jgi:hypothetical protein
MVYEVNYRRQSYDQQSARVMENNTVYYGVGLRYYEYVSE